MIIKGRTFVVSGAASGLGLATARHLHSQGGSIALLDQNEEAARSAATSLGPRAKSWAADVTDSESLASAAQGVLSWVNETETPIGGVVCAAGVGFPGKIIDRKGNTVNMDMFDLVVNINLRGTIDLIRLLLPTIVKNDPVEDNERGVLILVSSVAAFDGQPGQLAYSASKGAIRSLVLPLARDLAEYGVRAVAIAPGVFESAMTAAMSGKVRKSLEGVMEWPKRFGKAEEFANLVGSVVANPMINATTLRLDGGVRMPSRM